MSIDTERIDEAAMKAAKYATMGGTKKQESNGFSARLVWGVVGTLAASGIMAGVGLGYAQAGLEERVKDVEEKEQMNKETRDTVIRVEERFENFEQRYERDQERTDVKLEKILEKLE